MKNTFARIIELPKHQVLIQKVSDNDDGCQVIVSTVLKTGTRVDFKLGFDTEEKMDSAFLAIDEKAVKKIIKPVAAAGL